MAHDFTLKELRTILTCVNAQYRSLLSFSNRYEGAGLDEALDHTYWVMEKVTNMIMARERDKLKEETED